VPRKSIKDILNVRIASLDYKYSEESENENKYGFSAMNRGCSEEPSKTVGLIVNEYKANGSDLKNTTFSTDILKTILDKFEYDYIWGENYDKNMTLDKSNLQMNSISTKVNMASNIIAMNSRVVGGPANVVIVPEQIFKIINQKSLFGIPILQNPLKEYNDRIFVLRNSTDINTQKYHLLTDSRILGSRESKMNKILKKQNKEINYCIISTQGHSETVIVIKIA